MGGYPAANGLKTRGDLLFRSGYVELRTKKDIDRFETLDIDVAFDLRTQDERCQHPLALPITSPPQIVELGLADGFIKNSSTYLRPEKLSARDVSEQMKIFYASIMIDSADAFCTFFDHLIKSDSAILIFCSFGKDRTGIAAALLLAALGVPKQIIREDYLLSSIAYRDTSAAIARLEYLSGPKTLISQDKDIIGPVLTAQAEYFNVLWDSMQTAAGSIENFIEQCLQIDPGKMKSLRTKFTE